MKGNPFYTFPSLRSLWISKRPRDRALTILFLSLIFITIGAIIYVLNSSRTAEKFTEFYILGAEGKAENYPTELILGKEAGIIAGIVNWEYQPISYELEIVIDGTKEKKLGPILLKHKDKWEQPIVIRPVKVGLKQKVELNLYKDGDDNVYRSVYLWINVKSSSPVPISSK